MTRAIRIFVLVECIAFLAASLTHFGILVDGYQHQKAGTAEGVIGIVLLVGLTLIWIRPASTRITGLAVQSFALFGTLIGIFTIAVGVGPRTVPDIVFHAFLVILLLSGLVTAVRTPRQNYPANTIEQFPRV
jgi:hypothetical protein